MGKSHGWRMAFSGVIMRMEYKILIFYRHPSMGKMGKEFAAFLREYKVVSFAARKLLQTEKGRSRAS